MPGPRLPLRAVPARCRRDKVCAGVAGLPAPPARGRAPSAAPGGALPPAPPRPTAFRFPQAAPGRPPPPQGGLRGVKVMGSQPVCREARGDRGRGARGDEEEEVVETPLPAPIVTSDRVARTPLPLCASRRPPPLCPPGLGRTGAAPRPGGLQSSSPARIPGTFYCFLFVLFSAKHYQQNNSSTTPLLSFR